MSSVLLDTVTVSEIRRGPKGNRNVWHWQQEFRSASLSVITLNEILFGIRKVERKDPDFAGRLNRWYANLLIQPARYHILEVDRAIAEQAAEYRATHGTDLADSLIAATAKVHGLTLATRNTADFQDCDIALVNPWEYSG
ncbi:MAG TPA: type II toxin-antitoxin system VapC family toxin [Luteolibacter sp.]|nr:type II toxin-antitoxin system VapC family toxin [Luteolibacter sp.]